MPNLIGVDGEKWDALTPAHRQKLFDALREVGILSHGDRIVGAAESPVQEDLDETGWYLSHPTLASLPWHSKRGCDKLASVGRIAVAGLAITVQEPLVGAVGIEIVDAWYKQCLKEAAAFRAENKKKERE